MELSEPIETVGRTIQSRIYRNGVFGIKPAVPVTPASLEAAAQKATSRTGWGYLQGSAGVEATASANRESFDRRRIVPRMLRDVHQRDIGIELLGRRRRSPFVLSPIGVLETIDTQADLPVARAAAELEIPMMLSTAASCPMEEIGAAMGAADRWYQLYWSNNDDLVVSMLERAERAGCSAIVVTLDTPVLGWRPRDLDLAFLPFARGQGLAQYTSDPVFAELVEQRVREQPAQPTPKITVGAVRSLVSMARRYPGSTMANLRSPYPRAAVETFLDVFSRPSVTWKNLDFLRESTNLPILLKGIQHRDDAARAVDAGMDGIVVSNHGGRQVDGAIASLDALPGVVAEVADRIPVVFDSGVRGGADAFKALALGATAIGIGRPYAYGLAIAGQEGVREVMESFLGELDLTMALTGCRSIDEITPELLTH